MSMISRQRLIEERNAVAERFETLGRALRTGNYYDECCDVDEFITEDDIAVAVEALSHPPADVPDANVGEITKAQAIEALKTLKTYCDQYLRENGVIADYKRSCDECPLDDWCWYDREYLTPDDWQIPQERTEE